MLNRENRILKALEVLSPISIELKNESQKHAGHIEHLGSAGFTGETHYKLLIVSLVFKDLSRIDRQRKVLDLIQDEFKMGLHAFEIKAHAPDELK